MEEALAGYRSIAREFPQSRYAPAALLRQGDLYGAYYRNFPAALEAYDSLVFNYPRAAEAPKAQLRTAEVHLFQYQDPASASAGLERLRKDHPRFEEMDEALFLLARAYGAARDGERQAAVLSELMERYPKSPRVGEGRWMLAYSLLGQRRHAEADREFRKLLYLAADRKTQLQARWGVGQSLEGMGDIAGALAQYEALRGEWDDPGYIEEKIARLSKRMRKP
jgi:TolA-binding protein